MSSAFNAHALGALAEVAGSGLNSHIGMILPPLIMAMGDDDVVKQFMTLIVFFYKYDHLTLTIGDQLFYS